jgi:NitT/TauT family transport system substrate-binding protein
MPSLYKACALGLATMLALAACAPASPAAPTAPTSVPSVPQVSLKIANLPYIAFAPFYIAIEEGYFRDQHLDVELVNFANQPDVLPAFLSNQVDVISGQTSAGMNNFVARGADVRFVADKGYIDPNSCDNIALIARKGLVPQGAPVTGAMLAGQTINVVTGTWNEYLIDKLLAPIGLTLADFNNVDVPPSSQPLALESGQLGMVMENEPWVTRLVNAGNVMVLTPTHQALPNAETAVTMYGSKLIGANAEVGNRFTVAYLQAVRQYNEGKTERNLAILAQYTQLDTTLLKQMCWPAIRSDGTLNVDSLLDFQQWAINKGLQQTALTREQLWDPSFVTVAAQRLATK